MLRDQPPARKGRWVGVVLVPVLLVSAVATLWAAWAAQEGHDRMRGTASEAVWRDSVTNALSDLTNQVSYLLALNGLASVPSDLAVYRDSAGPLRVGETRTELIDSLANVDQRGPDDLRMLELAGYDVGPAERQVFTPLSITDRGALTAGHAISIAPEQYVDVLQRLRDAFAAAPAHTAAALNRLATDSTDRPVWLQPGFIGLAVAVWALAISAALWARRRAAQNLATAFAGRDVERRRADNLDRRNAQLLTLVDVSRRLSAENGVQAVCAALAEEAAALVGADTTAVLVVEGGRLVPVHAVGPATPVVVAVGTGVVGRAVEAGVPLRTIANDPVFRSMAGPLALLVAPLVADGRVVGAIVAANSGENLPDETDEVAFRLLALSAGPAIETGRAFDSTASLALQDPLTGLANRRRLEADLADIVPATVDAGQPVAFCMVDIDHFKAFNDTFGHPAGDVLLRDIAATLRRCVRASDIVYRFGGEEFAVLLPDATPADAGIVAERIRSTVEARQAGGPPVTVSVGFAWRADVDTTALVEAADQALYRAKRAGRNRVAEAGQLVRPRALTRG